MSSNIKLRVRVETTLCQGHNRCHLIAPELFETDDDGNAKALGGGNVPSHLEEKAKLAVKNCPEHAVRLLRGEADSIVEGG